MLKFHSLKLREALIPKPGPQRVFGLATLINTTGLGLVVTAMTLYFTRVAHLSTEQLGVGMTLAAIVGILGGIPIGHLADRRGPREVVRMTLLIQGGVTFCYIFVHGFVPFLIVASLEMLCINAYVAADGVLMRRIGGDGDASVPNIMQAIGNLGVSVGAVGCGIAVTIDTALAYRWLIIINALTFVGAWAVLWRLPHYDPLPKPEGQGGRWIALADKPFVVYAALAGLMSMQYWVIVRPLPLWVADHTDAPRWIIPALLILSTVVVILFQVHVGRKVDTIRRGGAALRRSGVIFLVSCSIIGLAAGIPEWITILLLIGAVTIHTIGELYYSAGSFVVSFGLPPEHAQGEYQGLAGIGLFVGGASSSVLMIGLVLSLGRIGWVGLGGLFFLLGLAAPAVVRWGERTRPAVANPETPGNAIVASELTTLRENL
jgi:MFS family permease